MSLDVNPDYIDPQLADWNQLRAHVEGDVPHLQVWLNGIKITDWRDSANHSAVLDREFAPLRENPRPESPETAKSLRVDPLC